MKMTDFMAVCFFMDGPIIDKMCDDFDIDIDEDEFFDSLRNCYPDDFKCVGRDILMFLWIKVAKKYEGHLEECKFSCDVSSPSFPSFYYDGKEVKSKKDLDEILGYEI